MCSGCLWACGFRCCFTPLPGCFSPFPHGTGPLSVTGSIQPWRVVPPASGRVPRVRPYSGIGLGAAPRFAYGAGPPLRLALPGHSATRADMPPGLASTLDVRPHDPRAATPRRLHAPGFGLGALSLAATRAISVDFSSSAYLDVSVRRVVPRTLMGLGYGYLGMTPGGFPHSETSGCKRVCAPRRRLSQLAASFIDCLCQGIHLTPVISYMLTPSPVRCEPDRALSIPCPQLCEQ